jgi:hypothetical protein
VSDKLQEIREREAKATKGPWGYDHNRHIAAIDTDEWGDTIACLPPEIKEPTEQDKIDLGFIAHSRQDIPYLLKQLQRETERADAAEKEIVRLKTIIEVLREE